MADADTTIDVEIAIVGAGPAGLVAALAFVAAGFEVALIAPPAPPVDHRTTALLSGSVAFLDRIGGSAALSTAAAMRTMRLVDGTRRLVRAPEVAFHASELGLESFGANVANRDLVAGLAGALEANSDGRLRRVVATLETAAADDRRIRLTTSDGAQVTARLAVAADGRKSRLREAAGITAKTWAYPQTAVVLNLDHDRPHYDTSTEIHTETGPFTLVPLAENRSSLVCVEAPETAARLMEMGDAAFAEELGRRSFWILGRLDPASPRQSWPMSSLTVDRLTAGRIALVGETAHAFPPIGAQGLNLGIRDIAVLAETAARARTRGEDIGGGEVLDRYARARKADILTRTYGVDLLNRSLLTDFLPVQVARAAALQMARDIGPLRKFMMREGMRPRLFQSL